VADHGIREIAFCDDQFLGNAKWVSELCDLIIGRKYGLSLTLPSGTSIWLCTQELLKKMREAGFYRLNLPVESGNAATLKFIRKPVKLPDVLKVIRQASQLGFWTTANFIIGFPYETRAEIEETIRFAYNCGVDYPVFLIAKPHVGSEMYDIYEKEGLIQGDEGLNSSYFTALHPTKHFTAAELDKIYKGAVSGYLRHKIFWSLNPKNFFIYIFPKFSTWAGLRYAFKLLLSGMGALRRISMNNKVGD
jgi:magnesium-protoporphyrin IX monomethyl ester (oxidative) cyclase